MCTRHTLDRDIINLLTTHWGPFSRFTRSNGIQCKRRTFRFTPRESRYTTLNQYFVWLLRWSIPLTKCCRIPDDCLIDESEITHMHMIRMQDVFHTKINCKPYNTTTTLRNVCTLLRAWIIHFDIPQSQSPETKLHSLDTFSSSSRRWWFTQSWVQIFKRPRTLTYRRYTTSNNNC